MGIHVGAIGELAIDNRNNLVLVNEDKNAVDVFPPWSRKPSVKITGFPFASILGVAINHASDEIWVTDAFWGHIYGVTYLAGQIVDTISGRRGLTLGIATSPD